MSAAFAGSLIRAAKVQCNVHTLRFADGLGRGVVERPAGAARIQPERRRSSRKAEIQPERMNSPLEIREVRLRGLQAGIQRGGDYLPGLRFGLVLAYAVEALFASRVSARAYRSPSGGFSRSRFRRTPAHSSGCRMTNAPAPIARPRGHGASPVRRIPCDPHIRS
jgi:hypothetical protein